MIEIMIKNNCFDLNQYLQLVDINQFFTHLFEDKQNNYLPYNPVVRTTHGTPEARQPFLLLPQNRCLCQVNYFTLQRITSCPGQDKAFGSMILVGTQSHLAIEQRCATLLQCRWLSAASAHTIWLISLLVISEKFEVNQAGQCMRRVCLAFFLMMTSLHSGFPSSPENIRPAKREVKQVQGNYCMEEKLEILMPNFCACLHVFF